MATKRKWSELSRCTRRLIVVAAVAEAVFKVVMLVDVQRRPAALVRGPKWMWRLLAFVNLLGPLAYFAVGRRRSAR